MTSINSRAMYPVQNSVNLINNMREQFAKLQTQLSTGKKAGNLAELGTDRYFDLSIRGRIGRIEGYQNNVDMVSMRIDLLSSVLQGLDSVQTDARSGIKPGAHGSGDTSFGTVPVLSQARLEQTLTLLNMDADGRYLFAGNNTENPPMADVESVLNGSGGKAGFKQVAAERQAADVGDGLGRLTLSNTTDTATLVEDGVHPFGFKLASVSASNLGGMTPTTTAGPPKQFDIQFTASPNPGDTITIGLTLPDQTSTSITLTASTGTPGPGEFQIDADPAVTAANFTAALQTSLTDMGSKTLVAASNYAAADNFFNGNGETCYRVDGPPFATATALVAADPTTTVEWYHGSSSADPRSSVTSRIDEASTVAYGVQGNESGTTALVRSLAVLSIQTFSVADPTAADRFDALATRNGDRLSALNNNQRGSIQMITVEMGTAKASAQQISDRNASYSAQLEGMLSDLESVNDNEVATELLALQTRLQATYQTTSLVSQLSLVNYIK